MDEEDDVLTVKTYPTPLEASVLRRIRAGAWKSVDGPVAEDVQFEGIIHHDDGTFSSTGVYPTHFALTRSWKTDDMSIIEHRTVITSIITKEGRA